MAKKKSRSVKKSTSQVDELFRNHPNLLWLLLVLAFSFLLIIMIGK